jgi:SAM-dependent methyltransferase
MSAPDEISLFEGAAPYYSRYRFGYPPELISFLVERFALDPSTPVLDLGCGTGQLAIPLAQHGVPVEAIDPDIEMLAEGLRAEQAAGVAGVAWRRGDDAGLARFAIPELRLCTMGASFHWMDRDRLLGLLNDRIAADGGVAVVDGGRGTWSDSDGGDWSAIATEVVRDFLGPDRRAGSGVYRHPKDRHEVVLGRSAFSLVSAHVFTMPRRLSIDDIIGLQLSTSYASPGLLKERIHAFRDRLRTRLSAVCPSGAFEGELSFEVLAAVRPTR